MGSLSHGALTAVSMVVVSGVAAAIGVVIAREFGRTAETDGLLAAYGLFVVIAIGAQAIRVAILPQLAVARQEGRLAGELTGFAVALAVLAVPLLLVAELGAGQLATLLTGDGPESSRETAAEVVRWIVPAGVAHLFAGLAASGLAAIDDYGVAALGYAAGSAAGLALVLTRVEPDGIIAIAWGMTLNGAIALLVPAVGLALHAARLRMPPAAVRAGEARVHSRLGTFAVGAALPLALQLLYVVCLPFASRIGTGAATTFVYAYLAGSALVTVTAGSLGLVTAAPLSRAGWDAPAAARHVIASAWLVLALVGAAAGVFALAGGDLVGAALGDAYGGDVGSEVGRLVVALSPWMIAAVGVTVTFPLTFIARRTRRLPWIALAAVAAQAPLAWAGSELADLEGLALALAGSTLLVLGALLVELRVLVPVLYGLLTAAGVVLLLSLAAFVPPALVLGSLASAAAGLVVYGTLVLVLRPPGLLASWRYLRLLS